MFDSTPLFAKYLNAEPQTYSSIASALVRMWFPGVAERLEEVAQVWKQTRGLEPMFGLFWNFCINGIYPDMQRVHCAPHADRQNFLGVCVIQVYCLPGCELGILIPPFHTEGPFTRSIQSCSAKLAGGLGARGNCSTPSWSVCHLPLPPLHHSCMSPTNHCHVHTHFQHRFLTRRA